MSNIEPQPGPQSEFLGHWADIVIYGGAAGGGKTFALLMDPLYDMVNPQFSATIFRRTTPQIRNQGGLWDQSMAVYSLINANPSEHDLSWDFPSGARVKFSHLEYNKTVLDWQGSQIPFIGFDELTHFTEYQFFYMLSRNRSTSGVRPRVRGGTNPDVDSWVRQFIDWWIGPNGLPIQSRAGVVRWFIRIDDSIVWGASRNELMLRYGRKELPKSVTFIPSNVYDNKILMEKDPGYLANLKAQNRVDRERLLGGNWNVRASAGNVFRREWFTIVDAVPADWMRSVRYWDRASTKPHEGNRDPDSTAGVLMHRYRNGQYIVADVRRAQDTPLRIEQLVKQTASYDSVSITIGIEQDPGSAGVAEAQNYVRLLAGYDVRLNKVTKDKQTRAKPVSAQCEAGNILVLRAPWNDEFFRELENFPEGAHDDQVDALSGAFNSLCAGYSIMDVL